MDGGYHKDSHDGINMDNARAKVKCAHCDRPIRHYAYDPAKGRMSIVIIDEVAHIEMHKKSMTNAFLGAVIPKGSSLLQMQLYEDFLNASKTKQVAHTHFHIFGAFDKRVKPKPEKIKVIFT